MMHTHWMSRKGWLLGGFFLAAVATNGSAQLAKTPPMGWNSWNNFACSVSETLLEGVADAMVSTGMKDAGYRYVNVDDCWEGARDANGFVGTTTSFTGNSLKTIADYVHGKGLKFGTYTSLGSLTCQGRPATLKYESQDVRQWVNWGVDYIKVDWCNVNATQSANPGAAYKVLGDTIQKYAGPTSARPLLFSLCNWGVNSSWTYGRSSGGQMWRTTPDITSDWNSFTSKIDAEVNIFSYAGPGAAGQSGGWNDPDMLEVGRGALTADENRSHFGMWCLLTAPLIAGNDIRNMTTTVHDILTNGEVIAVDQDSLGVQAQRISSTNQLEVWAKPMTGNARAVGLFNRSGAAASITVNWADLNKWTTVGTWSATTVADVRDLWTKTTVATGKTGNYTVQVPSHGLALLKLSNTPVFLAEMPRNLPGITVAGNILRVDFPGVHTVQILDVNGKMLWRSSGVGRSQYQTSVNADGSHILRLLTRETSKDIRY